MRAQPVIAQLGTAACAVVPSCAGGFGYVKHIKKQGVTRRVHASGESKSGIDPFMKMKRRDLANQRRLLTEIHENFIAAVKEGRGERLQPEAAAKLAVKSAGCAAAAAAARMPSWPFAHA